MDPQLKIELVRAVPQIALMTLPIALVTQATISRCVASAAAIYIGALLFNSI